MACRTCWKSLLGLLLLLQHGQFMMAAATRSLKATFPVGPPIPITIQPPAALQSNMPVHAAPMPMGRSVGAVPAPSWHPTPATALGGAAQQQQQPGASAHMRLAAPQTAARSAAEIPFAPSIPYNPNSLYRQQLPQRNNDGLQAQSNNAAGDPIPESHPVGMLAPGEASAAPAARGIRLADLINTRAQALSSWAKEAWKRAAASASEAPDAVQQDDVLEGSPRVLEAQDSMQQRDEAVRPAGAESFVSTSSIPAQSAAGVFAAPWSNNVLQPHQHYQHTTQHLQQHVSPAVRPAGSTGSIGSGSAISTAASGVMPVASRSRLAGSSSTSQQQPTAAAAAARSGSPGGQPKPAVMVGQPALQPLAPGVTSMATNNMGAPAAGPLGGPTYSVVQPVPAAAAAAGAPRATAAVSTAGLFSSAAAPSPSNGLGSLQQHFAGPKPPQYAPLSATLHVAPPQGSKGRGSSTGPSIDDVSTATGAPVAQVTWQLPKKTHVVFAPAAELLRAAPVSPFELPSSMQSADSVESSRGAVTHHLTPTWAPAY